MPGDAIDQSLAVRLDTFRREHGDLVRFDRVSEMVVEVVACVRKGVVDQNLVLIRELETLASYIRNIKHEIASVRPDEIQQRYLPTATDELDAIVESTETATNAILAAAEVISDIAATMEGTGADRMMDVTTSIYEACSFQDITGQRIGKVVKALKVIEARIDRLTQTFSSEIEEMMNPAGAEAQAGDASLLNGPQLPEFAKNQDEIDALFG
ncbi:MAG: protein phosphatase CheZ [Alphaproteobacteria bacterium]|nr:protein phosphatase CheZ [Alphaproteobacteria bacterium]